uniref:pleckstrin homology domain-containing family A member 8 isoform X2 n=1 Tax=Ciona intestinalis TaxID=7719 RepID=UPI000EF44EC3|nr:pleckstrin homology domain-containing family A member 8 isoform X2 [Ciona intestinalis]|eukprot:XP_026694360.1 pleckstrin homology domain-containing family A member 8 isoform X2 [Ciona intestinalis]
MEGEIYRWHGYLSGWGKKYFVLHNGTLSCFASKVERMNRKPATEVYNLGLCEIIVDHVTPTQFELKGTIGGKVCSLKTDTKDERQQWIKSLGSAKACLLDTSTLGFLPKPSEDSRLLTSQVSREVEEDTSLVASFESVAIEPNEKMEQSGNGSLNNLLLSSDNPSIVDEPEQTNILHLCDVTKTEIANLEEAITLLSTNEIGKILLKVETSCRALLAAVEEKKLTLAEDEQEAQDTQLAQDSHIDNFSTFFSSQPTNFRHVVDGTISREGKPLLPALIFLEACQCYLRFFDRFSGTVMTPLRNDIEGNIGKIRKVMKDSGKGYDYLQEIVDHEISRKQHTGPDTATQALLWLNRALSVMCRFLKNVVTSDSATKHDTGASFISAYNELLAKHHNWMVQKLFKVGLKMVPSYEAFQQSMIDQQCWKEGEATGEVGWLDVLDDKMAHHVMQYIEPMGVVVEQLRYMYTTHNIDP